METQSSLRTLSRLTIATLLLCMGHLAYSQCITNTSRFPSAGQSAPTNACETKNIVTNQWTSEFSVIGGFEASQQYEFSITDDDGNTEYITIAKKNNPSVALAHGASPLIYTPNDTDSLQVFWNDDSSCGSSSGNSVAHTTSIIKSCGPCTNATKAYSFPAPSCFSNPAGTLIGNTYGVMDSLMSGTRYDFTSAGNYITLRDASNSNVMSHGYSPVVYENNSSLDSIEIHINTNSACTESNSLINYSVRTFCPPPCQNSTQFPSATQIASITNTLDSIEFKPYAGEYSKFTNLTEGNTYRFTSQRNVDPHDFITVRDHNDPDRVLASGQSPLTYNADGTDTVQVHYNLNDGFCGVENSTRVTTVQCMSCAPALCDETIPVMTIPTNGTCSADVMADNNVAPAMDMSSIDACTDNNNTIHPLWYKLEVPASGSIEIEMSSNQWDDARATLYTGRCDSLFRETCRDFSDGITFSCLPALDTVYLMIWDDDGGTGSVTFCIKDGGTPAPPVNSSCYCAADIIKGVCQNGSIISEGGSMYSFGLDENRSAYYKYTHAAAAAENISVSVDMLLGPDYPMTASIEIYNNCFEVPNANVTIGLGGGNHGTTTFIAAPGEEYIIEVRLSGYGPPQIGSFQICLDACTPAANDLCSISVPSLTLGCASKTTGSTSCSIYSLGGSNFDGPIFEDAQVYYQYTPVDDSTYTFMGSSSEEAYVMMQVQESCDGTIVASGYDQVSACLTGGTTYYIGVSTFGFFGPEAVTEASFDLCVTTALNNSSPTAEPNDGDCSTATPLVISTDPCMYTGITQGYACPKPSGISSASFFCTPSGNGQGTSSISAGSGHEDVWFSVTYPADATKILGLELRSNFVMGVELYFGSCGNLALGGQTCVERGTAIFPLVPGLSGGSTVFIRAYDDGNDDQGNFDIRAVEVPINSNCNDATPITASMTESCETPISGTTRNARSQDCCDDPSVWYTYTPTVTDTVIIDVSDITYSSCLPEGMPTEAHVHVQSGCGNDHDAGPSPFKVVLPAGTDYKIKIEPYFDEDECTPEQLFYLDFEFSIGFFAEQGFDFNVCMYQAPEELCATNLDCDNATSFSAAELGTCKPGLIIEDCDFDKEAWYTHTVPIGQEGIYTIAINKLDDELKPYIRIYESSISGTCDNKTVVHQDVSDAISVSLSGNKKYYFQVSVFSRYALMGHIANGNVDRKDASFNFCLSKCTEANLPSNTTRDNAEALSATSCLDGNTLLCGGAAEAWYSYTPTDNGDFNFTVTDQLPGLIPIIEVFGPGSVDSFDDECYNIDVSLDKDETYSLRIRFESTDHSRIVGSDFTICVEEIVCTSFNNGSCTDPIGMLFNMSEQCIIQKCNNGKSSAWFFISGSDVSGLSGPTDYTVSSTMYAGINSTTRVYRQEGSDCNNLIELGEAMNHLTFTIDPAHNYYIEIVDPNASSHPFLAIEVDFEICLKPCSESEISNNVCTDAIALDVSEECCTDPLPQFYGCPTNSEVASDCGNGPGGDMWYTAVVPASGALVVRVTNCGGPSLNLKAAVYSSSCAASMTQEGLCSIGYGSDEQLWAYAGLTPGTTLRIQIWNAYGDGQQEFDMCAWDPFPSDCPEDLILNGTVAENTDYAAANTITSDQEINAAVSYIADVSVIMNKNFQVNDTKTFDVYMDDGCVSQSMARGEQGELTDISQIIIERLTEAEEF